MIRVALRGLAGRKFRTLLTAIAIVLGVAMMSGAYVLTDTIDKAFDAIFVDSYADTDAVVTGKEAGISFEGESAPPAPIPESVLEQVRGVDGVEVAAGSVQDLQTKLIKPDGESIDTGGAPSFAFGVETAPEYDRFNPLNLVEGRWPEGGREVAIDEAVAEDENLGPGDRIGVAALGPARQYEIVGVAKYGDLSSIGGATFAIFDIPTAQALLDKEGELDAVQVAAEAGVTPDELVRRIQAEVGSSVTVQSGSEQATEDSDEVATFTTIIRYFLLTFAGIALFVGAFVIFNTLSITVAQRTREFATLRTVGASRRQVLGSVIVEALVIGLLASVLGLFAGLGLAIGLNELFVALNLDLPQTDTVFATRTIVVSLLVGTLVTLAAGLSPALRATRVPPIAAVREGAQLPRSALSRHSTKIAAVTVLIAVARALLRAARGRHRDGHALHAARRRRARAVRRGRPALVAPRRPARPHRRAARAPDGRRGRQARRGQRDARPRAHRLDRGRADDRHRARDVRRRAGAGPARVQQRRDRAADPGRPRRHLAGRLHGVPGGGRRRGRASSTAPSSSATSARTSPRSTDKGANLTGLDGSTVNEVYDFRWMDGNDEVLASLGADGAVLPDDVAEDKDLAVGDSFSRAQHGQQAARTSSSAGSTRGARSIRCSGPRASRRPPSTRSTSGRATASR